MEPQKDLVSGRHLIEGSGIPVDGGIFRKKGHPGIVADSIKMEASPIPENAAKFKAMKELILEVKQGGNDMAVAVVRREMPINITRYQEMINGAKRSDRYSLEYFFSKKDAGGNEVGGGSPDAQALMVALLIELKLKTMEGTDRKVYVQKDTEDGHAIVVYKSSKGETYKFDPTNGASKFTKVI